MILHTCPHCRGTSFYTANLGDAVHCHQCGRPFELSPFTRTEKGALVRTVQSLPPLAWRLAQSRALRDGALGAMGLVILWLGASWFGVIPDAVRLVTN